eukprot:m.19092 g.19092  ORF g.19092 m.19092 type:complete len:345 (-) comp5064_c1_seq1:2064-3098(-)
MFKILTPVTKTLSFPSPSLTTTTLLQMRTPLLIPLQIYQRKIHSKDSSKPQRSFMEVSRNNKQVKLLNMVKTEKQRRKSEVIRVEGLQMVTAALQSSWKPNFILTTKQYTQEVLNLCEKYDPNEDIKLLSSKEDVVVMSMKTPRLQHIVACGSLPPFSSALSPPSNILANTRVLIILACQDPTNMGSIIRTAVAHGIHDFLLWKNACSPFNDASIRASAGAVFNANIIDQINMPSDIFLHASILGACSHEGEHLQAALNEAEKEWKDGSHLRSKDEEQQHSVMLVFGHETKGLPKELKGALKKVHIKMDSCVESLGVGAAAAILINQLTTSMRTAPYISNSINN